MSLIPIEANKIEVAGATVDFFELAKDGVSTYYFDSSKCGPPDPMVNAMSGLRLIKNTNNTLVMINFKSPGGLFAKLEADIAHTVENMDGGLVKITFTNVNSGVDSDLTQTACH
ncbi:hypothetical protein SMGD1_0294 [Sulfurimonas gotlandica GD1]|jgi:hypothetical protein|uniref:Uncharacterized protein n=1 Tax=Sulfurimonas gotlandica (strain DSM 19862 / JCM 16533 / GD1) TaxID=929558 RepID=B6BNL8_SULGG|nr:hypothetical protein [Sulfurimonas gotlandica]EDZ61201.1 conserved hypothetical protein [Sulfurimonas gotlandica GD1]EHP28821.1 hypothetical protein SMGD1_0294 [Sulfurimonas gotlandica GD1]